MAMVRRGFDDDMSLAHLRTLKPAQSLWLEQACFDLWVAGQVASPPSPPHWAGVKFFNVYGPNEYHKGKMISVVKVKHDEIMAGHPARLFKSDQPGFADGAQSRDFIHIDDVVAALKFLLTAPDIAGLYNLGTGIAAPMPTSRRRCAPPTAAHRISNISTCRPLCAASTNPSPRRRSAPAPGRIQSPIH